jgi:hypothetical protein
VANKLSSVRCSENCIRIKTKKTKEVLTSFGKNQVSSLIIDRELIERVSYFKLLGAIFSSDLSCKQHVSYTLKKVSKCYFIIFLSTGIGIPRREIILIYCASIFAVYRTCVLQCDTVAVCYAFILQIILILENAMLLSVKVLILQKPRLTKQFSCRPTQPHQLELYAAERAFLLHQRTRTTKEP